MPLRSRRKNKKNLIYRLTRTATGLFYPAAGQDSLYAIGHFKNGYDIVRLDYEELLREKVSYFSNGPWLAPPKIGLSPSIAINEIEKIEDEKQKQTPRIQNES